jgi:hypothetical protein
MKIIDRISETQRSKAGRRFKTNGYKPYSGPFEPGKIYGVDFEKRSPLIFNPPIYAYWRAWR